MTLSEFLQTSYTPFHAVANARGMLEKAGFKAVDDFRACRAGDKRFLDRGSALVAVSVGAAPVFHVAESHVDSPCLKMKTIQAGTPVRLDVEKYGGGIPASFLDRKLLVAGRIVVRKKDGLHVQRYVGPTVIAPSLAPHFGAADTVQVATDLYPILGGDGNFLPADTVDYDLYAVPCEAPFTAGMFDELLCAPRIDNLTSVYASVRAIVDAQPAAVAIAVLFDREEVGSNSPVGAEGGLLSQALSELGDALGFDAGKAAAQSFALSVDNAHAMHPAHPEKADRAAPVTLDGGIVVKHHCNYATDGVTAAVFKELCRAHGIPVQDYYHPSDLRCGSTLGPIAAVKTGIPTCDVGCAQLAMHAALETVHADAPALMQKALTAFFADPLPRIVQG